MKVELQMLVYELDYLVYMRLCNVQYMYFVFQYCGLSKNVLIESEQANTLLYHHKFFCV